MARLVDANDRLAAERLKVTVRLSGEDVGVGRALAAWRTATSELERELAAEALTPGLTMLAAAQRRWLDDYDSVRHGLGFDTQADLIRAVHEDVTGWLRNAERSLEETRESFVREHAEWRRRDGRGDSPTMVAIPVSNVPVPSGAAGSEAAVRGTVSAWGFPDEAARIPIDLVPRPGKLAGALCGRIDPPRDVRVTGQPTGGSLEYALMLHEFGHGLHFTIGPDRAFDMFGDDQGITEGFGRTFETVARQPRWFELFVGITLDEEAAARLHFNAVMSARLDAVQVLYEHRLFTGTVDPVKEYIDAYRREIGIEMSPHLALTRMVFFLPLRPFYALYLYQADVFGDALWRKLSAVGGVDWYANDRCRPLLAALFRSACERGLDDLLHYVGAQSPTA